MPLRVNAFGGYFHYLPYRRVTTIANELIRAPSQVKASLALEQKRVTALRGALAETEASDSGHSGGECESTSGDSSLEQVLREDIFKIIFVNFCSGGLDLESSLQTI